MLHPYWAFAYWWGKNSLFNWLYSKNQKGDFYLRVEDTDKDQKMNIKIKLLNLLNGLVLTMMEEIYTIKKIEDHIGSKRIIKMATHINAIVQIEIEEQKKGRQKNSLYI